MFRETLLDSSPSYRTHLTSYQLGISCLVGLVGFAAGAIAFPRLPGFTSPWAWLEGGLVSGFIALLYALMVCHVVADARQVKIRPGLWLAVVLAFNLPGLVCYLVFSARKTGDWKRIALPLAYSFEATLLGVCLVMPLVFTEGLPKLAWLTPVPPPPAGVPRHDAARGQRLPRRRPANAVLLAPTIIPRITTGPEETEPAPEAGGLEGITPGLPNAVPNGVFANLLGESGRYPPLPPSSQTTKAKERIVVGGEVEAAKLISGTPPEYPTLARMARAEGTVRLAAVIGRDGTIQDLRVLGGHPLLIKAAVEAVERWRYQPTLLDGKPVEVETEIEVRFKLSN
jgi:periplasmic protein TonB